VGAALATCAKSLGSPPIALDPPLVLGALVAAIVIGREQRRLRALRPRDAGLPRM
jgi:hypothetical protein